MKTETNRGLTLIETLVAISVLMVAVSGALSLANKSLQSAVYAKDQVVAFYLAEEGIEGIRNIRDGNLIGGSNWLSGLGPCGNGCYFDATTSVVASCSGICPIIQFDPTSGLYGYSPSWQNTIYRRTISMTTVASNERLLTVTVTWNTGTISRTFTVKELLFDWYE